MNVTSISPDMLQAAAAAKAAGADGGKPDQAQVVKVSHQFECILLRQFLGESMKPLLQGPSGQVYGYLLTDSLANTISEGGGLGLAHVLQTQLGPHKK